MYDFIAVNLLLIENLTFTITFHFTNSVEAIKSKILSIPYVSPIGLWHSLILVPTMNQDHTILLLDKEHGDEEKTLL